MRKPWSQEDVAWIEREYANSHTPTLAKQMERPVTSVYQMAARLGIKKSPEYLAGPLCGRTDGKRGGSTRFRAGHETWNKGMKGICGTHPNCRRTQFKAGRPASSARNYIPIGSYRLSKDGYLEQKVTDDPSIVPARRWVGVHRLVWEAANGKIPAKHVVCFRFGRRTSILENITLDALELVYRGELAQRNHPRSRSPELAKLVQLKGAITRQVNRIAREAKGTQS